MPAESLLMASVRTPIGDPPRLGEAEAEAIVIRRNGSQTIVELEDGRRYYVDALELEVAATQ